MIVEPKQSEATSAGTFIIDHMVVSEDAVLPAPCNENSRTMRWSLDEAYSRLASILDA
jgi:hypothetical protein